VIVIGLSVDVREVREQQHDRNNQDNEQPGDERIATQPAQQSNRIHFFHYPAPAWTSVRFHPRTKRSAPADPPTLESDIQKIRMRCQRMRAENQPRLLTLEYPMNKRLDRSLHWRNLLRECLYRKMLHAEHLINCEAGEHLLVVHYQDPALLAQRRE